MEGNTYKYVLTATFDTLNTDVTNHTTSFKFYLKTFYLEEECFFVVVVFTFISCLEGPVNTEVLLNPVERNSLFLLLSLPASISPMSVLR